MNTKNYSILMNGFSRRERKEFLLKFSKGSSFLAFKEAFSGLIGKRADAIFFDSDCKPITNRKKYDKHVLSFLKKARSSSLKKASLFKRSQNRLCLYIPVVQGDNAYGYILFLDLKYEPEKKEYGFMNVFIGVALKEFQKEQELAKLYDTIRPRAIALSTIHTVHRLLTSTLDLDELIERIARLTSQVMRSRHCSIMLLDESRKYLIPKAAIDLKNNVSKSHKKFKKIKIGVKITGKVAKTGKAHLARNLVCVPLIEEDIIGIICASHKINNAAFNKFDLEILLTLAEQAVIAIKNAQHYEEQKKMVYGSIKSLGALLDAKSLHTFNHSEQFVKIVLDIAEEMGLSRKDIRNLRYAALLPDTGRYSIPDEILKKQDNLSKKDYDIIKKQHLESLKILEPLEFLKPAMPIIIYHHERYDGSGYPKRLKGEKIPIGARIMAVADAFEAMVSARPYKDTKTPISQALKEIENNRGTQFDPKVVDAFMVISKKPEFSKMF